jgi:hypothetical protein
VGEAVTLREGRDVTPVATGGCVAAALAADDRLRVERARRRPRRLLRRGPQSVRRFHAPRQSSGLPNS